MAKGRNIEIPADKIIISNEEAGSIPFFLIDDDYGISGNAYDYSLVVKKKSNRSATQEDMDDYKDKYIQYTSWNIVGYFNSICGVFECYVKAAGLERSKKLDKTKDYHRLINIYEEIHENIRTALQYEKLPSKIMQACKMVDSISKMEEQISSMKQRYDRLMQQANDLEALIKEKRSMIIKNMEPKKHRIKLEE